MFKSDNITEVDVKENKIINLDPSILEILLKDRTTKKNIIWGTDTYKNRGAQYFENCPICIEQITGRLGNVIKPRIEKSKREQLNRSKNKAEVFTPSWICNKQNNMIDEAWFGYENVFNKEIEEGWITNHFPIKFNKKNWEDYVKDIRLEMSCGEAPYLVSRYDTVTGNTIPVMDRIGILDRKIRIICENISNEEDWIEWTKKAIQSTYGYDWQGDNILIARENLLYTVIDFYEYKFNKKISNLLLIDLAEIISWNIWQMDGIKGVVPNSCKTEILEQFSFFGEKKIIGNKCVGCEKGNILKHNGKKCVIMDWEKNKKVKYISLIGGKNGK